MLEDLHVFELLGSVNLDYNTVCAQVTSQDPLPPSGTVFALLRGKRVEEKQGEINVDTVHDQSALAINNPTNPSVNVGFNSARGCGRRSNRSGGRGHGGVDRDKFFCILCGRYRHA